VGNDPAMERERRCPYCDSVVRVEAKFCENCGRPVQETVKLLKEEGDGSDNSRD
jgi:predicted amidophosphoribosyltransferase